MPTSAGAAASAMCFKRAPAVNSTTAQTTASIRAVPKSGSATTNRASNAVAATDGTNVRQNDASSPARLSRKRARKIASAIFAISDGCIEKPAKRIHRRAPLIGEKANTPASSTTESASRPYEIAGLRSRP